MAHGYCRPGAAACACNGGGSQSRRILRGADVIASLRRFAGTSTDADRFTVYACRPRDGAAERSAAAATPFAFGLPGAHARLRARMAESEGNGPGSRQDLVRIRSGLSHKVNLRQFGRSEQPRAPTRLKSSGLPVARHSSGCAETIEETRLGGHRIRGRGNWICAGRGVSLAAKTRAGWGPARCQGPSSR
jgi:hypothetical protein